jgi:succinylglutamate desuccinylase
VNLHAPEDTAIVTPATSRLIGHVRGARPGPMILAVAAIHGNEPAGVAAARRVLARLEEMTSALSGDFVAFTGNVRALAEERRVIDRDLNRQWTEERIAAQRDCVGTREPAACARTGSPSEDLEQYELVTALEAAAAQARGEVIFLDLHTTSAAGFPFVMIGDNLRNRRFALHFPMAIILGLEEVVDGPLLEYWSDRGYTTFGVEGGQHQSPGAVDNLESALWVTLVTAGLARREQVPDCDVHLARLSASRGDLPHVLEVLHRHAITPEDRFVMAPDFANIQRVRAGELLAHDRNGEIRAVHDDIVFLPLYQAQGDDGFFLGREVKGGWLVLSAMLRRLHAGPVLRLLPGVRRDPAKPRRLIVEERFIRWYPLELLNLFGFRKIRQEKGRYLVSRRRQ